MSKHIHFDINLDSDGPNKIEQFKFAGESSSVISFCSTFFNTVKKDNILVFRIFLGAGDKPDEILHFPDSFSKYITIYLNYDFQKEYFNHSDQVKKSELVKIMRRGIEFAFEKLPIDPTPYFQAIASVEALDGNFSGIYRNAKISPDRKNKAYIEFNVDTTGAQYALVIKSKINEIKLPLFSLNTDGTLLSGYGVTHILDDGDWLSNEIFQTHDRASEIFFNCNVVTKEVMMEIKPKNQSPKELQWLQDKFEIATTKDEKRKEELMRKFR